MLNQNQKAPWSTNAIKLSNWTEDTTIPLANELHSLSKWSQLTATELETREHFVHALLQHVEQFRNHNHTNTDRDGFVISHSHSKQQLSLDLPVRFGSALSGMDTYLSDVDILFRITSMLMSTDNNYNNIATRDISKRQIAIFLRALAVSIRNLNGVTECRTITTAAVPVVKVTSRNGFTVDIIVGDQNEYILRSKGVVQVAKYINSVAFSSTTSEDADVGDDNDNTKSNSVGNHSSSTSSATSSTSSTSTSSSTSSYMPLFRPMVHFLRLLLRRHGLDSVYGGGLNSYRLYALVLSFLRTLNTTIEKQNKEIDVGEALLSFLEYHGGTSTNDSNYNSNNTDNNNNNNKYGILSNDRQNILIECPELLDGVTKSVIGKQGRGAIGFAPCHRLHDIAHIFRTTRVILTKRTLQHDFVSQRIFDLINMLKGTCREGKQ